jgi:hypothetical protein
MIALGVVGGVGTRTVDALTQLTPITGNSSIGMLNHVDVYQLKCPSGALSLEVTVTDPDDGGGTFHVMLTGLSPAAVYGKTVWDFAYGEFNEAVVGLSRSAPGAIKALLHVRREGGFSGLYDYVFTCKGVGGVNRQGSLKQTQDELP